MKYFPIVFCLMVAFSCVSNPFWQDTERNEIRISGNATAEENELNASIFVWIKELNVFTYTLSDGDFVIPLHTSETNNNAFSGKCNVYFFIHNYKIDSASFNLAGGQFSQIQSDFTVDGKLLKDINLKNMITGFVNLNFGANQLHNEDTVRLVFNFNTKSDVQIKAYKYIYGHTENHSGIIFRSITSGTSFLHRFTNVNELGQVINDQLVTLDYINSEEVMWEYSIHTNSIDFPLDNYAVYPVFFINHSYPSGMSEALGLDSIQFNPENFFNVPSTIQPDTLISF